MQRKRLLIVLEKHEFRQLAELAKRDERIIEQQARFLLKHALRCAQEQPIEDRRQEVPAC